MVVTCKRCLKSVSRYDDSISCSKNSSHIFHIQCENITVDNYEQLKKSANFNDWVCHKCCDALTSKSENKNDSYETLPGAISINNTASIINDAVKQSMKNFVLPSFESLRTEIHNLKTEMM